MRTRTRFEKEAKGNLGMAYFSPFSRANEERNETQNHNHSNRVITPAVI